MPRESKKAKVKVKEKAKVEAEAAKRSADKDNAGGNNAGGGDKAASVRVPEQLIGIREARLRLGSLLKSVREGTEWVITDRGRPVAKLVPVGGEDLDLTERIRRLEETGWLNPPPRSAKPLPPPLPVEEGLIRRMLEEGRGR